VRQIFVFILLVLMYVSNLNAQKDDQYRDKNWNPNTGKYFFSTQLIYAFRNDFAEDESTRLGEISIYLDEKTGTFLFTPESYGTSGEMVDFVIADQEGNYIFGYTDEHGKKQRETLQVSRFVTDEATIDSIFQQFFVKTGVNKSFGENTYVWPIKIGEEYQVTYQKTNDTSFVYLINEQFSYLPIYHFNALESEAKLPFSMDYSNTLPKKYNVLGQRYENDGKTVSFGLTYYSPTEYFIDLKEYKSIKK
jgi:hypothetical protein